MTIRDTWFGRQYAVFEVGDASQLCVIDTKREATGDSSPSTPIPSNPFVL